MCVSGGGRPVTRISRRPAWMRQCADSKINHTENKTVLIIFMVVSTTNTTQSVCLEYVQYVENGSWLLV